ncbi:prolyl oligopeptidase family serine peptidase [Piscinibacter sakaiensis]|uniref:Peptidase S9 prolyl oligopeptidase catalytic domain-containing protein n=1 Tax=Piscinibacter sakaiensis TaxID=1547922 RepID=A0A0K8P1D2_PISS1|nr:prolyl oligopeptidase family serine peptidase [Piscinibacter sakaiensis]GAP36472.1 hypothetical protein ISF6_2312 [Piscinibacter sakaiensis]
MLSLSLVTAQAQAPAAAPPPIEDFFKNPAISGPQLSPNGKYLAVLTPVGERMNLAVVDLETRKGTAITNVSGFDVLEPRWIGNDRLIFSVGQQNSPTGAGQFAGGGLFVVSRDGKESRQLAKTVRETRSSGQFVYRRMEFLRRIPGTDEEILVAANLRSADSEDVYRLNLRTGRTALVTSSRPERTVEWVLDDKGVPRVARSWIKDTSQYIWHYRKDADSPFTEIARTDSAKGPSFAVLGFLSDGKTLMVAGNPGGRDTMAVYRFDPEAKQFGELLAQHPRYDMGADAQGEGVPGVILEPDTDRVKGYAVQADKPQVVWLDEKEAKTQAAIDGALPDTFNTFRRFPNSSRILVTSRSDVQPERWYLLDEEKRTLEELFSSRPWVTKAHRVQQRSFVYKTRDGLEIPGYYFLPAGYKPGDKLPTIVHIHGGPSARADTWGRGFGVLEGQLFASRGYAVVVPNFRVTPGLGTKLYYAGIGTFGRQMSEDHEDAAAWAVKEGFADPKRMCISGASYGGYATLWALAKTPDLFKCGIAGLVVSDVERILSSQAGDIATSESAIQFWHELVGLKQNPNALRDYSPVRAAAKIKAPLFMYAGADDIRTPLEQTTAMISALESAGNPPKDVVIKKEEGHGFGKVENNVDLYTRILKFLDEQIGSKSR